MHDHPARDSALLLLRLCGLYLALGHGLGKVMALISGQGQWVIDAVAAVNFPLPGVFAWILAATELVGGLAIALGLYTRLAAALAAFAMGVAAFGYHLAHLHFFAWIGLTAVPADRLEAAGSPERAVLYAVVFVALVLQGGGRFALDARLGRQFRF